MHKSISLLVLLMAAILSIGPVLAMGVPDMYLKSEAQDATLVTPIDNNKAAKGPSSLEVFVDTLLGKNIGSLPEKTSKE